MTHYVADGSGSPSLRNFGIGSFEVVIEPDAPLQLRIPDGDPLCVVEVFTADEQRARSSLGYRRSELGERLRVVGVVSDRLRWVVSQVDADTGLQVDTVLESATPGALRITHHLNNTTAHDLIVTAIATVVGIGDSQPALDSMRVGRAESEWVAEGRWKIQSLRSILPSLSLPIHEQDGRGRFSTTGTGAWSTGQYLPMGLISSDSATLVWQIDSGAGWHWSLTQGETGAALSMTGPTEAEHDFAHRLEPGTSFEAVPVTIAVGADLDAAFGALTEARRAGRALRAEAERSSPVVYNDFMNTLMGDPSAERLAPLIAAASRAGAEVFCIDAGWFADDRGWWDTVGEWAESTTRFPFGLSAVTDSIRVAGMRVGLWLEPEMVGVRSPVAQLLPDEAFFTRWGRRVKEGGRYQLDFRHPAAVAHLDETVDRLVNELGVSYLKLDHNVDVGIGTQLNATSSGDGLLGHVRAVSDWLASVAARHPALLIEWCSSGAMRADGHFLQHVHLQSTSDQQDVLRYPPIAVAAPAGMLPEQAANWSYPSSDMDDELTAFTLATGLAGRLYLSGFLNQLRPEQQRLTQDAVALAKAWNPELARALPRWPLGLPEWESPHLALVLTAPTEGRLIVWSRGPRVVDLKLPGRYPGLSQIFPDPNRGLASWASEADVDFINLTVPAGPAARVFRFDV